MWCSLGCLSFRSLYEGQAIDAGHPGLADEFQARGIIDRDERKI